MRAIKAGKLRQQVTIQRPVQQDDAHGQAQDSWEEVGVVYASVWPKQMPEALMGGQSEQRVTHEVRIRYTDEFLDGHRLLFNGRVLNVLSWINVDEMNHEIQIMACEVGHG